MIKSYISEIFLWKYYKEKYGSLKIFFQDIDSIDEINFKQKFAILAVQVQIHLS